MPRINKQYHCTSAYFEHQLKRQLHKQCNTFIFAASGAMASDQCMILSTLSKMHRLPKVIVCGITPRDFINDGLFCPASTSTFQYLNDCFNVGNLYPDVYENKKNLIYSALKKHLWLYKESSKLSDIFAIWWQKRYPSLNVIKTKSSHSEDLIGRVLPSEQQFIDEPDPQLPSRDIIDQYVREKRPFFDSNLKFNTLAYVPFPSFVYKQQLNYFQKFISLCKSEGIRLIVVNMPTTKEHMSLLGEKRYQNYLSTVKDETEQSGCRFIDMNTLKPFAGGCFYDSIHLNPIGAKLFVTDLVKQLVSLPVPLLASARKPVVSEYLSWWMNKAYLEAPTAPDIVILGNSQLGPLLGADAYVYNKPVDITGDHRAGVVEYNLGALLDKQWKVFVSALPSTMILDQLIISRKLFLKTDKPKLVALAVSPENFIGGAYNSPACSEVFSVFTKCSSPYEKKNIDFSECISPLALRKPFKRVCPGQVVISSADGYTFASNTEEYRLRYKNPLSPRLKAQMQYFDDLLKFLAQQHIKVIVFGMPLTTANRKLLPTEFWSYYHSQITYKCKKYDADWVDIDTDVKGFSDKEFMDSVHLNLVGGHRLASTFALYIANKFHWRTFDQLQADEKKLL